MLLQRRDQVGVIHVKSRPQDNVGSDHANDVSHDPLLPKQAPNPWFLAKIEEVLDNAGYTVAT